MKTITLLLLIICFTANAQKVQVFDIKGKLITPEPIEKKQVPEQLKEYPDGYYKIIELKATKEKGYYFFKSCTYLKQSKKELI